ncbi:hypothetical protein RY831_14865 [Noviherbaspirillum sp. CPCC 100848]|uniref:Uncharacterized protein n=1 Tax=Noviherbaspirillum album TaxID=3080276 RepID=A0ABU6J9V6_9BURK|nr:hypothetical protein [Noviherbaspirillum sp. CPCC 100848]MEC4720442.1 hypothetical protein [Noviherbaspirillum sp. CPCC 100848]
MAKVHSAAKVIEDELKQARKAVAFYTKRIEDLEDILATLSSIDAPVTAKRGRAAKDASASKASATKTAKSSTKGTRSTKLPSTGKDFWPGLLTDTPQSSAEVLKAAIAALRIRPNPDDRKKLTQRMANALSVLSKNGEIKAEGEHRNRLYSKRTA